MLIYTDLVHDIIRDMAATVRGLAHIDADRLTVLAASRCGKGCTGNLALCCGLDEIQHEPSFSIWARRRSKTVTAISGWYRRRGARFTLDGRPMRYAILLRLPRMLKHDPLETIVHELYHIGEAFDGHLRPVRHGAYFDRQVARLTGDWMAVGNPDLRRLARMRLEELQALDPTILAQGLPRGFAWQTVEPVAAPMDYPAGMARFFPGYSLPRRPEIRAVEPGPALPEVYTGRDLTLVQVDAEGLRRVPAGFGRYLRQRAVGE